MRGQVYLQELFYVFFDGFRVIQRKDFPAFAEIPQVGTDAASVDAAGGIIRLKQKSGGAPLIQQKVKEGTVIKVYQSSVGRF